MHERTILSQIPHGARFILVPSDFPQGTPGTLAYRQQLLRYFHRDEAATDRYRRRALRIPAGWTVRRVYRCLDRVLERERLVNDYMALDSSMEYGRSPIKPDTVWSEVGYRSLAVYPTTGTNEGVYVNVEFVGTAADWNSCRPKPHHGVMAIKTWQWEDAWRITRRVVELLEA